MRYLIDTNIFLYMVAEQDMLSRDVWALIEDSDTLLYMSVESVKELIVLYRKKKIRVKSWKNIIDMIGCIEDEYNIVLLPLRKEHMRCYATLELNTMQEHNDPSDHVIIATAMAEHLPLISSDSKFAYYRVQGLDFIYNER